MTCVVLPSNYYFSQNAYLWHILNPKLFKDLPTHISVNGTHFRIKDEFHVTILNVLGTAFEMCIKCGGKVGTNVVDLLTIFSEYAKENEISLIGFRDSIRLAHMGGQLSLTAECEVYGFKGYFKRIEERFGFMPDQPPHVSLYTNAGIAVGIDTHKKMYSFPKLYLPEIQMHLNEVV